MIRSQWWQRADFGVVIFIVCVLCHQVLQQERVLNGAPSAIFSSVHG
jgi:hypothetical protein